MKRIIIEYDYKLIWKTCIDFVLPNSDQLDIISWSGY